MIDGTAAVDNAICAWITIGIAGILGAGISWWLFLPLTALSLWFGSKFIDEMISLEEGADKWGG